MIGKKIEFRINNRIGADVRKGIILDSILIERPQYKYDEHTAAQRGFNYTDGQNIMPSISVTAYLIEYDGKIGNIDPRQIISIID
jgi:hypothetical protein